MKSFDADSYELAPLKKILANGTVTATTSAGKCPATAAPGRRMLRIQNLGSVAIYWGTSTVTDSNGIEVAAGASDIIDLGPDGDLYVITASSTADVRYAELGG